MDDDPRFVEATGPDVETAIQRGLAQLGVSSKDVIVEVLEEPTRGFFGIGANRAKVRLTLLARPKPAPPPPPPEEKPEPAEPPSKPEKPQAERRDSRPAKERDSQERAPQQDRGGQDRGGQDRGGQERGSQERGSKSRRAQERRKSSRSQQRDSRRSSDRDRSRQRDHDQDVIDTGEPFELPEARLCDEGSDEEARIAAETLRELLGHMNIKAKVTAYYGDYLADEDDDVPVVLQITGRDLGVLIGRRGDTLSSLQYITRLIASRDLQRRANVIVDVEGYKARREDRLRQLALRMAKRAAENGRTISLEPMPAYERRIVHLALRDRTDVFTRSVGEGGSRKVTIVPVRDR